MQCDAEKLLHIQESLYFIIFAYKILKLAVQKLWTEVVTLMNSASKWYALPVPVAARLRRRSAAARLLRSWVRIPPGAWMFVCCECCVLSGRGLRDELITRPEGSYRLWCVVVCDVETSWMRRPWPRLGRSATKKKKRDKHYAASNVLIKCENKMVYRWCDVFSNWLYG